MRPVVGALLRWRKVSFVGDFSCMTGNKILINNTYEED